MELGTKHLKDKFDILSHFLYALMLGVKICGCERLFRC